MIPDKTHPPVLALHGATREAILAVLREHRLAAERAEQAPDLDAVKAALNACWSARIAAQQLIADADRETRKAALAKLEQAA